MLVRQSQQHYPGTGIDLFVGIGGAPEGFISAASD